MNLPQREVKEFDNTPVVGFASCKVVAINPTKDELIKLLEVDEDKQDSFKEKEYLSETDEGETKLALEFWLQEEKTNKYFTYRISLIDKIQVNKDGTKTQYINCTGDSSWAEDSSQLKDWFTQFMVNKEPVADKSYKEAHVGEATLYNFLRNWLSGVEYRDTNTSLFIDWSKLIKGNLKELTSLIGSELTSNIVVMTEVRIVDGDEGIKYYQGVYNKNILPGYTMKFIRNTSSQTSPNWSTNYGVNRFVEEIQGEYGSKNVFFLGLMKPFDESMTIASSDTVVSEDGTDY